MCRRDTHTFPFAGRCPVCRVSSITTGRDRLRGNIGYGLRVVSPDRTLGGVTALARLVQGALDAAGMRPADAMRRTGLSSQLLSQILKRQEPYSPDRPPSTTTLQALEKIPGLSQKAILQAVRESTEGALTVVPRWSAERTAALGLVEKMPEKKLPGVVKLLTTVLDDF